MYFTQALHRNLQSSPDRTVTVFGVRSEQWGEAVHAIVVAKPDCEPSEAALIDHCKAMIAGYKCPKRVEFRDALPLSGAGKVLKTTLREPYWQDQERCVG